MNALLKFALGAVVAGSAALVVSPSVAVGETVRSTPPRGEDARPCRFFVHRHLPAPRHCYRFMSNMFGPDVYMHGGYVFRDRQAFLSWRDRREARTSRLAEREDRYAEREHERYAAREETRTHEEISGGAVRGPGSAREMSGGPTRGEEAEEHASGGATRGGRAEQGASGGATRGGRAEQHVSGGASGY